MFTSEDGSTEPKHVVWRTDVLSCCNNCNVYYMNAFGSCYYYLFCDMMSHLFRPSFELGLSKPSINFYAYTLFVQ